MNDQDFMRIALELAEQGKGWVNPNPMVGALVVKDSRIIGKGYHHRFGGAHAEREALAACTESPEGATLYVTLEPCCHYGKTPPCTEAIIAAGISRVVIGSFDPNPLVAGKGIESLRIHGILVTEGILEKECNELNEVFFHYIKTRTPFVVMKYAMTMDGKIAARSGESRWITGETAREKVHLDRHRFSAIMVGVGTVLADDPMLNTRLEGMKNPVRIICDTNLRTPLSSQVVKTAKEQKTIIATGVREKVRFHEYEKAGCRLLPVSVQEGRLDLKELMLVLGAEPIDSILLEGGQTLNWSALNSGIVKKVQAYVSPKLFGGIKAKSPVGGIGVEYPSQAFRLGPPGISRLGDDILLESEVISCLQES